ncbi:hypothetical protein ES288_D08G230500v1 [Gossypium darwinii]|uniref:GST N-terminal domain-containing protein n=2 Tax=Gossypium darwinii TaxID=34276 RepID=A0A5D2BN53_GOSDA|nr:hypothetical protein ES288_D08G230500v1 [Gossypium darwinii]TYG58529.1 hypothetical protein ES288_D08G230500v1 [Gossypium darwinii]
MLVAKEMIRNILAKREAGKEAQSRTGKTEPQVFADRMTPPSRAVIIFCKVNGIDYTERKVDISQREHLTPAFAEINPMKQLPAIVDGNFKLFESHSILIYLACAFPGVADHWYPADHFKRSKIHSVLYWHHSNLCRAADTYVTNTTILPRLAIHRINKQLMKLRNFSSHLCQR